jgi:hypothetical protein
MSAVRAVLVVAFGLSAGAWSRPAAGGGAPDEARSKAAESFRQAEAAFSRRDWAAAAAAWEQAAEYEPNAAPLLNAADARERAGEIARAAEDCDRALATPGASEEHRKAGEDCLRRLGPRLSVLELRGPQTLSVRIDAGRPVGVPGRVRVAPGRHLVEVLDLVSSKPTSLRIETAGGEVRVIDLVPRPEPAPAARPGQAPPPRELQAVRGPSPEPRSGGVPTSAWIAWAAGGVAAGVAAGLGLQTLSARDAYNESPTPANREAFHDDKAATNVTVAIAAAAVVTGFVIWIASPRARGATSPGLAASPSEACAAAAIRF